MLNRVVLIGRLTHDPELKYTPSGVALLKFQLAVDRNFKNAMGERESDFFRIVAWRKLAELCAEYLSKGRQIGIEGQLRSRSFQTPEGEKRTLVEIEADNIMFLGGRDDSGSGSGSGSGPGGRKPGKPSAEEFESRKPAADSQGGDMDQGLEEEINLDLDDNVPF